MKTYTYSYQNGPCRGREAGEVPGQIRRRPQTSPRPRKVSNKLFQGFRGLGKAQTSCFKESEASERLKQVVSRFPRPRKGPNKLFQGFRRLGASTDAGEAGRIPAPPRGVAPIVHTPGVSPLAMIRRPYRALPRTRPGCRPGGP